MRHLCLGESITTRKLNELFDERAKVLSGPEDALRKTAFDALLKTSKFELDRNYSKHPSLPIGIRCSSKKLPNNVDEKWRNVYLDVTADLKLSSVVDINKICSW